MWWTCWVPNGSFPCPPGRTRRSCFEISPTSASQRKGLTALSIGHSFWRSHLNDLKSIKKSRLQGVLQDILDQICWKMDYKSCTVLKLPATGHGTRYTREMLIKQLSLEFSGESGIPGIPGIPKHQKSQKIVPWDPRTRDIDNLTTSFHICSTFHDLCLGKTLKTDDRFFHVLRLTLFAAFSQVWLHVPPHWLQEQVQCRVPFAPATPQTHLRSVWQDLTRVIFMGLLQGSWNVASIQEFGW